jgi:hypothetical protein
MASVSITERADGSFRVDVTDGRTTTTHSVTIPEGFASRIGCGGTDPGELVRKSFEFLLEREPPSSILREFSLDVISRYFPEYQREIGAKLSPPGDRPR